MGCSAAKPLRYSQAKITRKQKPSLHGTQITTVGSAKTPTMTDFKLDEIDCFQETEQYLEAIRAIKQHKFQQLGASLPLDLARITKTY